MHNLTIIVTLQYFKPSGKYYSEGEIAFPIDTPMWRVSEVVKELQADGELPDLVPNGGSSFDIYIKADDLKYGYPIIIRALKKPE